MFHKRMEVPCRHAVSKAACGARVWMSVVHVTRSLYSISMFNEYSPYYILIPYMSYKRHSEHPPNSPSTAYAVRLILVPGACVQSLLTHLGCSILFCEHGPCQECQSWVWFRGISCTSNSVEILHDCCIS